ncbi:hypothetical protein K491DRAFT_695232 [Lophiostoma macrostomum CBS 122681]|uniref:Uncharacterized protein n=1 Tax=Lophiostoma macrostomum CBS 122681 TaxID=1314788 RepID=A0A6A6SYG6_9PLEO|nr:hypothetical protein K491DRAFT_695232 [Lophiostoma macrostomum CBS 122681]
MAHCRNLRSTPRRAQKPYDPHDRPPKKNTRSTTLQRQTRSTRSRLSQASIDLDLLEAELTLRIARKDRANRGVVNMKASDTESDAESHSSNDKHSDSDADELENLSHASFASKPTEMVSRNASYDSRYDPGNENYELDEFVVADESSYGSEAVTDSEEEHTFEVGIDLRNRRLVRDASPRKRFSTPSTSSKLFCSETEDGQSSKRRPSLVIAPTESPKSPAAIFISDDPEEIVEQIMDALALYSRRCNRKHAPTTLILSPSTLQDSDVRAGLDDATKQGLGHMLAASEEGEVWLIGPCGV